MVGGRLAKSKNENDIADGQIVLSAIIFLRAYRFLAKQRMVGIVAN